MGKVSEALNGFATQKIFEIMKKDDLLAMTDGGLAILKFYFELKQFANWNRIPLSDLRPNPPFFPEEEEFILKKAGRRSNHHRKFVPRDFTDFSDWDRTVADDSDRALVLYLNPRYLTYVWLDPVTYLSTCYGFTEREVIEFVLSDMAEFLER